MLANFVAPPVGRPQGTALNTIYILGVYWRSPENRLIEAWYDEDGDLTVTDLSDYIAGLGTIAGTPAICDVSDPVEAATYREKDQQ